jgi:SAM-dependent methyltransferase
MAAVAPTSSGLHSVDPTVSLADRLRFLDDESRKPAMRWARQRSFELLALGPGVRVLDVGCGAGDEGRAMARLVAPGGEVVAIDVDAQMIAEARRRSDAAKLPIEFRVADVYSLDFSDERFDAARAERAFLHLAEPQRALAQMVRVVKRGGRIAIVERDIETRTIDASDRGVTRRILNFWCDRFLGGWVGRQLPRLLRDAGLGDITIEPVTVVDTDLAAFDRQYDLSRIAERAVAAGVITRDEAARWLDELQRRAAAGSFFASMTNFVVGGRKE